MQFVCIDQAFDVAHKYQLQPPVSTCGDYTDRYIWFYQISAASQPANSVAGLPFTSGRQVNSPPAPGAVADLSTTSALNP